MKTLNEMMPMIGFFSIVATVIASIAVRDLMGGGDWATLASLAMVIGGIGLFMGSWKLVDDRAKRHAAAGDDQQQ